MAGLTNYPGGIQTPFITGSAGSYNIPVGGTHYYVKPNSGLDSNDGKTPETAFKTLYKAHSACTTNKNDVVHLIAESATSTSATTDYQSSALTWSKSLTHLIGECPPAVYAHRSRIAQLSTATGVGGLLTVSGNGCIFANFHIFQGVDDATSHTALSVSGERNVFHNLHIGGIGHATMIGHATANDLTVTGSENVFRGCTIGLNTVARDASCYNIVFTAAANASRNVFEDCIIDSYNSVASYHVSVGATGIDRTLIFRRCIFNEDSTNRGVGMTAVFQTTNMTQGKILLDNCSVSTSDGTCDWIAAGSDGKLLHANMVAAAAAAAGGFMTLGAA